MELLISNSNPYGRIFHQRRKKLYVTENHFDSGGEKIVESVLIQFDLKKTSIIQNSNRDFTSLIYQELYN
jgi:hypothetical protein